MEFVNKKILVIGASNGIGKETSIMLSELGAKIVMIARSHERLNATCDLLKGNDHKFYSYDVSQIGGIESLIDNIIKDNGAIDGLVFCVGMRSRCPINMITFENAEKIMKINFFSFIEFVKCISKRKRYNKGLSIIAISSVSSFVGHKGVTIYSATKAALDSSVRCLAKELANKKIRVNSVIPSQIETSVYNELIDADVSENDSNNLLSRQYLGLGTPRDVANTVKFLLSNDSKFITGTSIRVDGGYLS